MSEKQDLINERINFLINEYANGVRRQFALKVGVSPGMISDLFSERKNKPGLEMVRKILTAYPQISTDWLVFGEGEMLKGTLSTTGGQDFPPYMTAHPEEDSLDSQPQRAQATDNLRILTVQVGPDGDENIELVPVRAAAGYAQGGFTQPTFISQLPSFRLPGAAYRNGTFRCFQVQGSSMQGTLQDGDWLVCRFVEKWAHDMLDNRVYVVVSEQELLVKRVLNQLNERGRLVLHSDNPTFDVQTMRGEDVREVWQGVARITQDLTNTQFDIPLEFARQQALMAEVLERLDKLEGNQYL